jgi:stalled ribosome rescue protein Dom34
MLHPEHATRHIHHKTHSIGSGHAAEDQDFFQRVEDAIVDAGAVLVTGPANAKTELVKHIEQHARALSAKIVGVATLDHPTDNEILAMARSYFKADHQMLPRIQ